MLKFMGDEDPWMAEQAPTSLLQNRDSQPCNELHYNGGKIFPPNKLGRVDDILVMKSNSPGKHRILYE